MQKSGRGNLRKDSRVSKMCFARGTTAGTGGQCVIQGRSGTSSLVATKHYRAVCSDLGWRGNPVKTHTEDHDHAGDLRTMDVVGKFTFCTDNNPGYQHQYWVLGHSLTLCCGPGTLVNRPCIWFVESVLKCGSPVYKGRSSKSWESLRKTHSVLHHPLSQNL